MSVETRVHHDKLENQFVIERVQDVEDILDLNKHLQGEQQKWAGSFRHIGNIPNVILEKWMNEDGVNLLGMPGDAWGQYIKRKLNDPDYRWLRTTTGRL